MSKTISVAEAASILGLSPLTIRRYVASGTLTGYRVGNSRFIRLDADEVTALLVPVAAAE